MPDNTINDLINDCKTSVGELSEENIRCALAKAYRAGYQECLGRLPRGIDGCSIGSPQWPIDEARVEQRVKVLREQIKEGFVKS